MFLSGDAQAGDVEAEVVPPIHVLTQGLPCFILCAANYKPICSKHKYISPDDLHISLHDIALLLTHNLLRIK
jgi:hypothetical protein